MSKITLTSTQERTLAWALRKEAEEGGGIIALKPGCGKTCVAVNLTCQGNRKKSKKDLYVVPPTLATQWQSEVGKFSALSSVCYTKVDETKLQVFLAEDEIDVIIISYYTLLHSCALTSLLFTTEWCRIIADEAHCLRNPDTKISQCMQRLKAQYRWALTGTVMINSIMDMFGVCLFLKTPDICSRHPIHPGRQHQDKGRARFEVALRRGLANRIMMQCTEEDILALQLPLLQEHKIDITMTPEEASEYNGIQRDHQKQALKSHKSVTTMLKLITDLRICAAKTQSKVARVVTLVQSILEASDEHKILVFCSFHEVIQTYKRALRSSGVDVLIYTGDVPQKERDARVERFKKSQRKYRVMILGFKCGNAGINLQCAQYVLLDAPNWHAALNEQAIARAYRKGQSQPVHVYRLHTKRTIEDRVAHLARTKEKAIQSALARREVVKQQLSKADMEAMLQL